VSARDVNPARRETLIAPAPTERVGRFTVTWFSQHLVGYGVGQAVCRSGGMNWGVDFDLWQLLMMAIGGFCCLGGWSCALAVFLHTKGADWGDGPPGEGRFGGQPPYGRLHFFAAAALVANVFFLTIMLLDGTASVVDAICRQS
jgi:hypothetical protein